MSSIAFGFARLVSQSYSSAETEPLRADNPACPLAQDGRRVRDSQVCPFPDIGFGKEEKLSSISKDPENNNANQHFSCRYIRSRAGNCWNRLLCQLDDDSRN